MGERPILFSAPMVRALLAGTKTQTRRVIKPRRHCSLFDGTWSDSYVLDPGNAEWREQELAYHVGDRLWVREAWRVAAQDDSTPPRDLARQIIGYEADCAPGWISATGKRRPSLFMPRWASRLTLTVTDVRVERLQDISEADARAEGVFVPEAQYAQQGQSAPVLAYAGLWEDINGPGSWEANPWVAAYTFTVEHRKIDAGDVE